MEVGMKPIHILMLAGIALTAPAISHAQVAGETTVGVSVTELRDVARGWSARRTILGHDVYNDKNERVGTIEDIIVAPDKQISYAIVGAGGFLGMGKHDVAVPVSKFQLNNNKLVLAGATKQSLKDSPAFEYAR
jgi:sporulation protein YlmC with PRC-barrel domain